MPVVCNPVSDLFTLISYLALGSLTAVHSFDMSHDSLHCTFAVCSIALRERILVKTRGASW